MSGEAAPRKLPPEPGPDAIEADWQWWVCARVKALDGEWFHVGDSLRAKVPDGWPDLVLLLPRLQLKGGRTQRQLVRELKLDGEEPTEAQHRWLAMFLACGVDAAVWHFPSDRDRVLREIGWREPAVSPFGENVVENSDRVLELLGEGHGRLAAERIAAAEAEQERRRAGVLR